MEKWKNALQKMIWKDVISSKQTDSAYKFFLDKFTFLYGKIYGKVLVTVNSKTLKNPWITKGILKSSKTKKSQTSQKQTNKQVRLMSMRKVIKTTVNYLTGLNKEQSHNITQRLYFILKITHKT